MKSRRAENVLAQHTFHDMAQHFLKLVKLGWIDSDDNKLVGPDYPYKFGNEKQNGKTMLGARTARSKLSRHDQGGLFLSPPDFMFFAFTRYLFSSVGLFYKILRSIP